MENFDLAFQGTVTARQALQMSLNMPAVELLQIGPARFLACIRPASMIAVPKESAPGLAVGVGGLGITLSDLTRLYAGLARGGAVPALVRRHGAPHRRTGTSPIPSRPGTSPTCRAARPRTLAGRISFKTGTSYGYRDAWAVGYDRHLAVGVWIGRPDGAPVPGLVGRLVAAPILFDAYARTGMEPDPLPCSQTLVATTATLPHLCGTSARTFRRPSRRRRKPR